MSKRAYFICAETYLLSISSFLSDAQESVKEAVKQAKRVLKE